MYIIIAILVFGILIAVHELGHFMAAKALNVRVLEFSIGMGPRLFKKQGKETLYSLKAFPIGGSCLMEGEDENSPDPRSFTAQRRWKRIIILVAGSFMNFVAGAIVVFILVGQMNGFGGTTVTALAEGFPNQGSQGLMVDDTIVSINGEHIYYKNDFGLFLGLSNGKPVDMVVERGGKTVTLNNLLLKQQIYPDFSKTEPMYGIGFNKISPTLGHKIQFATYTTLNYVRLVRVSLSMLVSGAVGFNQLSGPVGIVSAMDQVAASQPSFADALYSIASIGALVAVNLAVMNLLPIPALDGGRIFFLIVTFFIEKIARRRVDPKYEGYIHTAGFFLIIGLVCYVMVNDVVKLIHG